MLTNIKGENTMKELLTEIIGQLNDDDMIKVLGFIWRLRTMHGQTQQPSSYRGDPSCDTVLEVQ